MSEQYDSDLLLEDSKGENAGSSKDLHLVFRIEDEDYAINVADVHDILPLTSLLLRRVPKTPSFMKGIINNRGDIIPVICVRAKFMKPEKEYDFETCIVRVAANEHSIGLIVDKVLGVETISPEKIKPPPNAKLSFANQFIKNIGVVDGQVRMILSREKLIF